MTDFTRIKNYIRPRMPSVPGPLMTVAIRDAATELCERTRIWRHYDTISTVGNDQALSGADSHSSVFEIESAIFDACPIDPISIQELDDDQFDWRDETGTPQRFTQTTPDTIRLFPLATTAADLKVGLFLRPSETCTDLPSWLVDKHYIAIALGAMASLYDIPNQEFSDQAQALKKRFEFDEKVNKASTLSHKGQQRARLRSKSRWI